MEEELRFTFIIPTDSDGYFRRRCPSCESQFKRLGGGTNPDTESGTQLHCPLCGHPGAIGSWNTEAQHAHAMDANREALSQQFQDAAMRELKKLKGLKIKPNRSFGLDIPDASALHEPDDMVIVASPCHPDPPVKVPEGATSRIYCFTCGEPFSV